MFVEINFFFYFLDTFAFIVFRKIVVTYFEKIIAVFFFFVFVFVLNRK